MAVDTPTKRASALNVRTRCRRFLPVPDGTIDVADRAHLAAVYYEVTVVVVTFKTQRYTLEGASMERFTLEGVSVESLVLEGSSP